MPSEEVTDEGSNSRASAVRYEDATKRYGDSAEAAVET